MHEDYSYLFYATWALSLYNALLLTILVAR